jgi:DNA-binding NtrC family response regulator
MSQANPDSATPRATILVVEEVLVRLALADYLRDCGYKVVEAADAEEAVQVLKQSPLPVDVLFSAVELSGAMDGFGLSQWTRANRPGLEVILAGSVPRAVNAAAELCEEGPVPRPYEPQTVHDRIRRLLAGRRDRKPQS